MKCLEMTTFSTQNRWAKDTFIIETEFFEITEKKAVTFQNLWNAVKIILREKHITLNEYIRKSGGG